ncbi:MAG TPA: phosphoribosylanthranilate isomerase [Stellaceae bacterium]|jgi:phosphoribosylanthranilate isomerase|nr:phosphoribosylanthranilate isomerase [Stellaceae bacterium]
MSIAAKICGLTSEEAVQAAVAGGARFTGFVFYPPSPRSLGIARAAELIAGVPPGITRVGVFVDPDDALLDNVLTKMPLDMVQLHGSETAPRAATIKRRFGIKVMKAIKVASEVDIQGAKDFLGSIDWLMFDAKAPKDMPKALPGGNALAFDWELLRQKNWPLPWMLSGGLTVENLGDAVKISRAEAVDVSSGVERKPGEKDPAKIRAFLARAAAL